MRARALRVVALLAVARAGTAGAGPVEDVRDLVARDRAPDAQRRVDAARARRPDDAEVALAAAEVARHRCRLDEAEATYRRLLARDPTNVRAAAGLAETHALAGRPTLALAAAEDALLLARPGEEPARAHRAKALALVELRRYDLAVAAAERAVALAPGDARCVETLGAAWYRAGRMDLAGRAYQRATELEPLAEEANLRLGNGFGPRSDDRPWADRGPDAEAFRDAVAAWDRDDLADAGDRFLALVRVRPDVYKYRLGLGLVRLSVRRRYEARIGPTGPALYARLPAPELDGLEDVVHGYRALAPIEQHVVRVATAPAKALFPAIRAQGAAHDVLPLAADVADDPSRRDLVRKRTFDGRWYEHLRAVAGAHGATGAEKLREAADFGFNTFAHEFGHQVHRFGLSPARQREVDELYARAVATGACLDWYAASNADEYFAQGYEALLSPVKRGCLLETARHTRAELARKDPALHAFLLAVLDFSHEDPGVLAAIADAASRETNGVAAAEPAGR